MLRSNRTEVYVKAPSKGLQLSLPPDKEPGAPARTLNDGENIRAEKQGLHNSPGVQPVPTDPPLDSSVILVYQGNRTAQRREDQIVPLIGTEGKLFTVAKRGRPLVCSARCAVRFAFVSDTGSGESTADAAAVARLVVSQAPDFVVSGGDSVTYAGTALLYPTDDVYEELVAKYYGRYIWGYKGKYGAGPSDVNRFFPALGNHNYTDAASSDFLDFFALPQPETHYTVRRGPVEFFVVNSCGPQTAPGEWTTGDGVSDLSSTGPEAVWLQEALAASDCVWRVVVMHHPPHTNGASYSPGFSFLRWPFAAWGADLVLSGHSHAYERIEVDGFPYVVCGLGGQPLLGVGWGTATKKAYNAAHGCLVVDANAASFTGRLLSVDGAVHDTFSLTKQSDRELQVCYIGQIAQLPQTLTIEPGASVVEIGRTARFRAVLTSSDGSVQDVTASAVWSVGEARVASSVGAGEFTALNAGDATVQAKYGDLEAVASLSVLYACVDSPLRIGLLVDSSAYVERGLNDGRTRLQVLQEGVQAFVDALSTADAAAVCFASSVSAQASVVSTDRTDLLALSLGATAAGNRTFLAGLQSLRAQLSAYSAPVGGDQQWLALVLSGYPEDAALVGAYLQTLRDAGIRVAVVAAGLDEEQTAAVTAWATAGFFLEVSSFFDVPVDMEGLPNYICRWLGAGGGTGSSSTVALPPVVSSLRGTAGLNYKHFVNWDVVNGVVDLCGVGSDGVALYDLVPGNGLYVDLAGSLASYSPRGGEITIRGEIRLKAGVTVPAGEGLLTVTLAGNRRDLSRFADKVRVQLWEGNTMVLEDVVTIADPASAFTPFTWNFSSSGGAYTVRIRQIAPTESTIQTFGVLLGSVRIDAGATRLFYDDFNNEAV